MYGLGSFAGNGGHLGVEGSGVLPSHFGLRPLQGPLFGASLAMDKPDCTQLQS